MVEKYEEKFWGKIDFLHEKSKQEHNSLNVLSDIIIKFSNIISDFSKSIDNIKNRKVKIVDDKDSSVYKLSYCFKQNLKVHIDEFKECSNHMKLTIIDSMIHSIEEKYTKEKDLFNQYNKIKNIYHNSKLNCEKSRKDFEHNAKICEKNIFNLEQLKTLDFTSSTDVAKSEERMKLSIANAKTLEDKYFQCLEEANKARENEINKQTELLKYYQVINKDYYSKINLMIGFMVPMLKKMYSSILKSLESLEDHCKKINIQQDINNFIEKNKNELKPDKPILFEPYIPEASLSNLVSAGDDKKDLDNLDINYNVILTLYNNFRDIRKDLNMEEEKKKHRLRFLCTKIFKIGPGVGFKPEEKKELISLLNENNYILYFLVTLSKQRTRGRFQRSETLLHDLTEILEYILDGAEKEKNYEIAKNCIILSQTFYHEVQKGKNKKKKYLFDYIKNNKWLKDLNFWEGIIENMIENEIKKNESVNIKNNITETDQQIKTRISNIAFSQVLSYSNNMIEFMINKDDINKIVNNFVKKYEIEEPMAEAIYENIKNTPDPKEKEEKEEEEMKNNDNNRPKAQSLKKKEQQPQIDSRLKSLSVKNSTNKKIDENNLGKNNKEEEIKDENVSKIYEKNEDKKDRENKEENKILEQQKINEKKPEDVNMESLSEINKMDEEKIEENKENENIEEKDKKEEIKKEGDKIEENTKGDDKKE